ncbi:hypothetical protein JX265_005833 [Neoarthrinium moseri]|uniref:Acyltransferase 3 domain-containing protein n=1 Tax=Neoarthrinium moseri TaxID=1658444 RepID=A0A9Q0APX7_9PEZI|nr:hypothetical protein JX265_005833 [Neoarthrinium moseri]
MKTVTPRDGDIRLLLTSNGIPGTLNNLTDDEASDYEESLPAFTGARYGKPAISKRVSSLCMSLAQSLGHWGFCLLKALSPSFTHHLWMQRPSTTGTAGSVSRDGHRPILFLDGIRGIACLVVFNFHFLYPHTYTIFQNFGAPTPDGQHDFFHQLPYVCLIYRGRAMVVLFFALSGYVLSYRYLSQIRHHAWEGSQKSIASLTLRRFVRLYVPPTTSMFLVMVAAFFGAFEPGRRFQDSDWRHGPAEQHPVQQATLLAQLSDFARMWWDWSNPWTWNPYFSHYDPHTWTIPLEFRSSIALFALLVSRTRLRVFYGFALTLVVALYCLFSARWDVAVFLGGSLVADVHIALSSRHAGVVTLSPTTITGVARKSYQKIPKTLVTRLGLLLGLYLLSFPDEASEVTPGYKTMASWTPSNYGHKYLFWHCIACIILLWCSGLDEIIKRPFETKVAQYLGKISYALYLVHGPLLHSLGFALQPRIWERIGHESTSQWILGLFVGWMLMLGWSIVVADLFWRCIDAALVSFTKQIEQAISIR